MLTYLQVHLYFLFPPLLTLLAIYHPLLGRRDGLKIMWLCFMATLYTTPWDNWLLSQHGWTYPPGSILGQIFYIPLEEHLFFLIHSIFLVLLHALFTHSTLLPFTLPQTLSGNVQTLRRRPLAASLWLGIMVIGGLMVDEAHSLYPIAPATLQYGRQWFYMGWILLWVSPVISWLIYLGGELQSAEWKAWAVGSFYLCMVDTIAIRNGAWSIAKETTLGIEVVRGLPLEEFTFFLVVSYLVVLACSLIAHLHTLLLLSPQLPPSPPANPISHIALLARVALNPPELDMKLLEALSLAEDTLKKGSKSFNVAKLAFGREMRIGLIAMYAWCRVTDDLVDEPLTDTREARLSLLQQFRNHLTAVYQGNSPADALKGIPPSAQPAFHLFASIIPRLVPSQPFFELCNGYQTDIDFISENGSSLNIDHFPIKTSADLLRYADDVAGSIAEAICHLSQSILSSGTVDIYTTQKAREMGRALQLVNISRDIAKDALIGRLYIPISAFPTARDLLDILLPNGTTSYASYTLPHLHLAEKMRQNSIGATANLPRTARGGARAMAASYFQIAEAVKRNNGEVDTRGIKVEKWRRAFAAIKAFWGLS